MARAGFDARSRADEDLQTVAAEDINDLLSSVPQALPLPRTARAPKVTGDADGWEQATTVDLTKLVRTEGLDLQQPAGTFCFVLHQRDLLLRLRLPGAGDTGDLLGFCQAERPVRQQGSAGKDTKDAAGDGEVLGSGFGGAAGHFAEYHLTAAEPTARAVLWLRVARANEGAALWRVTLDGEPMAKQLTVEPTGSWNTFRWLSADVGELSPGRHTVRIESTHAGANVNFDALALSTARFRPPNSRAEVDRLSGTGCLLQIDAGKTAARLRVAGKENLALEVGEGETAHTVMPTEMAVEQSEDALLCCARLPAEALEGPAGWDQDLTVHIPACGLQTAPTVITLHPADLRISVDGYARTGSGQVQVSWEGTERPRSVGLSLKLRNRGEFRGLFGEQAVETRAVAGDATSARFDVRTDAEGAIGTTVSLQAGEHTYSWLAVTYVPPAMRALQALRAAVNHLRYEYRPDFDTDGRLAAEIRRLEARARGSLSPATRCELYLDVRALAHAALIEGNPLLGFKDLLLTRRAPLGGSHYAYTEAVSWARDREWNFRPPASLCRLSPPRPDGTLQVLIDSPTGVIRDPDVHYDGTKVLFAHKSSADDDFHLYEYHLGDGRIVPLTSDPGFADYEGVYLPDGNIIFNSTRCVQTVPCWITPVSNLYLMGGDGRHIRRVSVNQVHDNFPTVLEDGRVIYTRWEYNDKGQIWPQGLFCMSPDGTRNTAFYGNNSYWPVSQLHARSVKGTSRVVCTLAGHHTDQSGEIGIFDASLGTEEAEGCVHLWPSRPIESIRNETYVRDLLTRYQYPYSLSPEFFLVACRPQGCSRYGIYLIDTFGNRELVYEDPTQSCSSPMPIAPRSRPPVIPSSVDYRRDDATVALFDVYAGPGLAGVPRGMVKALRVIELIFRPFGSKAGLGQYGPAGGTLIMPPMGLDCSWDAKRVVGTVPVAADGSAAFRAPANTALCFQPLDAQGRALQWMRSWVTLMPGENASCVGCHEPQAQTPAAARNAAQFIDSQPPQPWLVSDRAFSFPQDVQPVLDRACVTCHDQNHPRGIDLRGDKTDAFSLGYEHLRRYVDCPGPQSVPELIPARSTGAITGRLPALLQEGHHQVQLQPDELNRIITWIDLNAPYYSSYELTRPGSAFGRNVVAEPEALNAAVGDGCVQCHKGGFNWRSGGYDTQRAVLVNLTHPADSRLLRAPLSRSAGGLGLHDTDLFSSTADPRYQAARALIEGWAEELRVLPREDMPGAKPSDEYLVWWARRLQSQQIERRSREALAAGR